MALGGLTATGYQLSETEDFRSPMVRLPVDILSEALPISIEDIPTDLNFGEGNVSGANYFAYNFWIKNAGEEDLSTHWILNLTSISMNLDQCLWCIIVTDDGATLYAKATESGEPEHLSGYSSTPSGAVYVQDQVYRAANGTYGVRAIPWVDDRIIAEGDFDLPVGEHKKFTVIMWIERDDPECTNDVLGGSAEFALKFSINGEEDPFDSTTFAVEPRWTAISRTPIVSGIGISIISEARIEIAPDYNGYPGEWDIMIDLSYYSDFSTCELKPVTWDDANGFFRTVKEN